MSNGDVRDCEYAKEFPELRHRVLVAERRQTRTDAQLEKVDERLDDVKELVIQVVNDLLAPLVRRLEIVEGKVAKILLLIGGVLAALQFLPEKLLESLWKIQ